MLHLAPCPQHTLSLLKPENLTFTHNNNDNNIYTLHAISPPHPRETNLIYIIRQCPKLVGHDTMRGAREPKCYLALAIHISAETTNPPRRLEASPQQKTAVVCSQITKNRRTEFFRHAALCGTFINNTSSRNNSAKKRGAQHT